MSTTENKAEKGLREAMDVAEAARETEWEHPSFAAGIFNGKIDTSLVFPYPEPDPATVEEGEAFLKKLEKFLIEHVDGEAHDRDQEISEEALQGLKDLGCFGLKIPKEYGGVGLTQVYYNKAVAMVATRCASTAVWLSAHQSIGAPQPLKLFGNEEQKKKYLPMFAKGTVSAFALTEPGVGSDPARMETTATPTEDGKGFLINGEKLWCTNGTVAEVIVVMALTPSKVIKGKERRQITAFIIETKNEGFEVLHRCRFMGIRAIANGLLRFKDFYVPRENILWEEGKGLKLALITLNTGRLTLPAACAGASKQALAIARRWGAERVQWGQPIGRHDAVSGMLASMAARVFAMESVTYYASTLADQGGADIRLEAAMAKLFASEEAWTVADQAMQILGGRGYETETSLKARGEKGWPVERILRDLRINRIIEGSTEIMHLIIAREALDPHMKAAGAIAQPGSSTGEKLASGVKAGFHYAAWYPGRFVVPDMPELADLPDDLREEALYFESESRRLSRRIFYAMVANGPKLEKRQRILFRFVDVGTWLFAMIATISNAHLLAGKGNKDAYRLAGIFCTEARRKIAAAYREQKQNSDKKDRQIAKEILDGKFAWLEEGIILEE